MNTEEKKSLDQKQDFIIETLFEYFKNGVDIMFENQAKFMSIENDKRQRENIGRKYRFLKQKSNLTDSEKQELEYVTFLVEVEKVLVF